MSVRRGRVNVSCSTTGCHAAVSIRFGPAKAESGSERHKAIAADLIRFSVRFRSTADSIGPVVHQP